MSRISVYPQCCKGRAEFAAMSQDNFLPFPACRRILTLSHSTPNMRRKIGRFWHDILWRMQDSLLAEAYHPHNESPPVLSSIHERSHFLICPSPFPLHPIHRPPSPLPVHPLPILPLIYISVILQQQPALRRPGTSFGTAKGGSRPRLAPKFHFLVEN